jgi:endonuclease/exonuclease/phosphatase family metal-dependent hydrolase
MDRAEGRVGSVSARGGGPRLRVVTLNAWGNHGALPARLDAAAHALARLAPDVILLQEVSVGGEIAHAAEALARRIGIGWRWAYAVRTEAPQPAPHATSEPAAAEEGVAVLSRYGLGPTSVTELPEPRPSDRRILLSVAVDVPGARAPIVCHTTHLHWRLADGVARERQVVAVDEAAHALRAPEALHVLGGDFNAAPDADEIRFLVGRHTLSSRRTYWQDAWAAWHPDEPGWTWARRNPSTAPLAWLERDRRIDYLFVSPESPDGRGRIESAQVVLDAPENGVWPSDHFGVMADILL